MYKEKLLNLGSTLGLGRDLSKLVGGALMAIGFLLATPSFIVIDEIFNIIIAQWLVAAGIEYSLAVAITFIIGVPIFLLGACIYPYNTIRLLNGFFAKLQIVAADILSNPVKLLLMSGILYWVYVIYMPMVI